MKSAWVVMPIIDLLDMTLQAIEDCLAQELGPDTHTRVLVISNGSTAATRAALEEVQLRTGGRVLVWHHDPPLATLNATWNRALQFCWEAGAMEALVVNNDIRLRPWTYAALAEYRASEHALFVSAVGVKEEQFEAYTSEQAPVVDGIRPGRGGPDYSCFLICRACNVIYPFDEQFTYFGDNDHHYRLQLAGDGDRIFSVNIPYLHYGSQTINRSPEAREKYAGVFKEHRERYLRKWGGVGGEEKYKAPYTEPEPELKPEFRVVPSETSETGLAFEATLPVNVPANVSTIRDIKKGGE